MSLGEPLLGAGTLQDEERRAQAGTPDRVCWLLGTAGPERSKDHFTHGVSQPR